MAPGGTPLLTTLIVLSATGSYVLNATYIYAHLQIEFGKIGQCFQLGTYQFSESNSNNQTAFDSSFSTFRIMVHVSHCELPHLGIFEKVGKLRSSVLYCCVADTMTL